MMEQADLFSATRASRNAHYPNLGHRNNMYARIVDYLREHDNATNKEIADAFGLDACSITGRIYELRTVTPAIVVFAGDRICKRTGNKVASWKLA